MNNSCSGEVCSLPIGFLPYNSSALISWPTFTAATSASELLSFRADMAIERVLYIEEDAIASQTVLQILNAQGFATSIAPTLAHARELLRKDHFDLLLAETALADGSLESFLDELQLHPGATPLVVVLHDSDSAEAASACLSLGAFDALLSSFSAEQFVRVLRKADQALHLMRLGQFLSFHPTVERGPVLLGSSPAAEELRRAVRQVAHSQASVLVHGPRGAGQEQIAAALRAQTFKVAAPFVRFDCAAPANGEAGLAHETSGLRSALLCARGGALLLENVTLLSSADQTLLLQAIKTSHVACGKRLLPLEARIIATSQADLGERTRAGEFREDLFHALNILPVRAASLRERQEDLPALIEYFRALYSRRFSLPNLSINAASLALLRNYEWHGNLRELEVVLERAVLLSGASEVIEPNHLWLGASTASAGSTEASNGSVEKLETVDELERRHILRVMDHCQGSRTRAAAVLGISIRTLRNKLKEYRSETIPEQIAA